MRMYDIIEKKRDGLALSDEEIRFFVDGYTDGSIPDYQASALCMAIFFRGMNDREISVLTDAMAHSGDMIDLSRFGTLSADKHSTGGVGDKTSLIVMPIVAALGAKVAKMTGRGLGHTGGTVDKLESIPGYQIALDSERFLTQVEDIIRVVNQMIKIDGWKPDMIYIDYLGCIQPSSDRRNKYDNEGVAMEVAMKRIDAFAKNNDIAIWVSQQTNRTAGQDDNLDTPSKRMATIQGAFRAIQPCTRVLYLIRVPGEFDRVNLYLDKARNAETSSWENAFFDNATCQINLSDSESGDVFDYRREEYEEPDTPEALGLR